MWHIVCLLPKILSVFPPFDPKSHCILALSHHIDILLQTLNKLGKFSELVSHPKFLHNAYPFSPRGDRVIWPPLYSEVDHENWVDLEGHSTCVRFLWHGTKAAKDGVGRGGPWMDRVEGKRIEDFVSIIRLIISRGKKSAARSLSPVL